MRYFKFVMAAGASMVVAARFSPAYALQPSFPLDINGPVRQGNMCLDRAMAPNAQFFNGYGYGHFEECYPSRRAHRQAPRGAIVLASLPPQHALRQRDWRPYAALPPAYPLDVNGPIRQGNMCLYRAMSPNAQFYNGYGHGTFYECAPLTSVALAYHRHRHHLHRHGVHRHHAHPHHRYVGIPATPDRYRKKLSRHIGNDVYAFNDDRQYWQSINDALGIDTSIDNSFDSIDRIESSSGASSQMEAPVDVTEATSTAGSIAIDRGIDTQDASARGRSDSVVRHDVNYHLQGSSGLPSTPAEVERVFSLGWRLVAASQQLRQSTIRPVPEGMFKFQFGAGDRQAPVDPPLFSFLSALEQRGPQSGPQAQNDDVNLRTSGGDCHANPVRLEAGGQIATITRENGCSPVGAFLGLVLFFGSVLALVATQLPAPNKAGAIETSSDLLAQADDTEWQPAPRAIRF